jgi:hypothetical protein
MISVIANRAKQFLSDKKVTVAIVAFAIAGRVIQLIYFYNIRVDASYQVMATQNLVYGHGISLSRVLPSDLSLTIYEPLINWPPGYSLLLVPFYVLFNHNYIAAGITLDILAALILIFSSRSTLKILNTPVYLINIYTLFTGFFIYYFYYVASSDAIAIPFFIAGLFLTLLLLKRDQHWIKKTIGISGCLFVCAFTKYLFMPVVFIIPMFLIIKGFADRNALIKKAGIYTFLFLTICTSALLIYQKYISGSATYIAAPGRGFFIEHLLGAYPFFPASFIKPDTIALFFQHQSAVETHVLHLFQWIHLLFILVIITCAIWMISRKGFKRISLAQSFFYIAFFVSLTITILLIILSIRVAKEEISPGSLWTYIQEPRYYGLPIVLTQLGIFVFYQYYRIKRTRFLKFVFCIFVLLLLPEFFRGVIFDINRVAHFNKEEYSWQWENRLQKYAAWAINNAQQKHPAKKVVVTGSSYYVNNRVILYSHVPVLLEADKINDLSSLNTRTPVLLLIILYEEDFPNFQPFLSSKEKEEAGNLKGFHFYTTYITPH